MTRLGLTVGVAIIIITLFLFFNADLAFGAKAAVARNILLSYMLAIALLSAVFNAPVPAIRSPPTDLINFIIGFVVTAVVVVTIPQLFIASITPVVAALSFGFLYAFITAFYEEVIFRDLIPLRIGLGDIIEKHFL